MFVSDIIIILTSLFPPWFAVSVLIALGVFIIILLFRLIVWIIEIIPGF